MSGISIDNLPAQKVAIGKQSRLRFLIPLAMIVAIALVACGSSASPITNAFNDGSSTDSGDLATDFSIIMFQGQDVVGGQEVNLRSLVGEKPIVLNFWAGLCPPCRAEMPDLQAFHEEFQDRVLMLGIDIGQFTRLGSQEDAKNLLEELEVTYPAGFTKDSNIIRDYRVLGMPTTVFIDSQGKIFDLWTGALNGQILEQKTLEMLNQ
ncbi:MAG: TlpA disulfide reductase family protein [Chloroflexi bacterium]|nr:TlpA disulfide reductase family protein [Chloroflexota bacterium]